MLDNYLIDQQLKDIATQNAADLCAALFTAEVEMLRSDSSSAVQQASQGRNALLSVLHDMAEQLITGDAGKALQQRTKTIQSYSYHEDGVHSVR